MPQNGLRAQIAEKMKINRLDLKAVVSHDEEWTTVNVYGSTVVTDFLRAKYPESEVAYYPFRKIEKVPSDVSDFDPASWYGLENGTVLLVSGRPPD